MIDISVIIPLYKGKRFLDYWMEILTRNFNNYKKEYDMQCEAVFVNDYPAERIRLPVESGFMNVINLKENNGIHGARVTGYQNAKGNYVVFLDQDDKISDQYLVSQKRIIGNADAVVCNGYRERFCIKGKRYIYVQPENAEKVKSLDNYINEKNWILSPGQVLLKKSSLPVLWLTEIMEHNGADDYFLWILMLNNGCIFKTNNQRLYTHMEYGTNTSNENESMNRSILEMVSLLEKNNVLKQSHLKEMQRRKCKATTKNRNYLKMIRVYDYWMYLDVRNRKIETYLLEHHYRKAAIYGMGYIGNRLYDALYESSIEIVFGIDAAAEGIEYDIPVLSVEHIELRSYIDRVDVIIVTAVSSYQDILHSMKKICRKPIVSIEEILLEMIKEI